MKRTIITLAILLVTLTGFTQSKPRRADTTVRCAAYASLILGTATGSTMASNWGITHIPHTDTIIAITYCVNTLTLRPKWFRLHALTGLNYGWFSINGTISIYKKYLNVPKHYKAVYSILTP